MLTRRQFYALSLLRFSLGLAIVGIGADAVDRLFPNGGPIAWLAATVLVSVALVWTRHLDRSYRAYAAARGVELPTATPAPILAVVCLWIAALFLMGLGWRVGTTGTRTLSATVAVLAFLGVPFVVLVLTALWFDQRRAVSDGSQRPAV